MFKRKQSIFNKSSAALNLEFFIKAMLPYFMADSSNSVQFFVQKFQSMLAEETNTGESNMAADLFGFEVIRSKKCRCNFIKTSKVLLNTFQL